MRGVIRGESVVRHDSRHVISDFVKFHAGVRERSQECIPLRSERARQTARPAPDPTVVPFRWPAFTTVLLDDCDLEGNLGKLNLQQAVVIDDHFFVDEAQHERLRSSVKRFSAHERSDYE